MKAILNNLIELQTLSRKDAYQLMKDIGTGAFNEAHIASLLTVLMMRPLTLDELHGFREALLELCVPFNPDRPTIDLCGTGGDSKNTFNISTLASFVVAACGYKVTKHGNYGVSSASGSSNVVEYLGYKFTNEEDVLQKQLDNHNICFLHAPLFHPALKHVAHVRKQMGIKTFFNMLGPLVNPAQPEYRLTGVFNLELARLYHYLLQQDDVSYRVLHDLNGYDEISLTGLVKVYSKSDEQILDPAELGFDPITEKKLFGGETVKEAAAIFIEVLENKGTSIQQDVVVANAAMAIQCIESTFPFSDCIAKAREAIVSGKALQTFKSLIAG
jgi:anthranilate phosphoribosyltransferase